MSVLQQSLLGSESLLLQASDRAEASGGAECAHRQAIHSLSPSRSRENRSVDCTRAERRYSKFSGTPVRTLSLPVDEHPPATRLRCKAAGGDEAMDGAGSSSAGDGGDYDDEPVLKYQRMGADVGGLLSAAADDAGEKETVVRMAVHDTCLVGTLGWLGDSFVQIYRVYSVAAPACPLLFRTNWCMPDSKDCELHLIET